MKDVRNLARASDVAVEVTCKCDGATLVREASVERWSCPGCKQRGRATGRRWVLGENGALPGHAEAHA